MKSIAIHDLGDRLISDLRGDYPTTIHVGTATAQPLRDRFALFGAESKRAGARLEEAMSAAIAALQDLFDRTGGQGADPATALAAGTALAALATSYHDAVVDDEAAGPSVADAPLPWLARFARSRNRSLAESPARGIDRRGLF